MKFDIVNVLKNGVLVFVINILAGFVSGFVATALGVGAIISGLAAGTLPNVSTLLGMGLVVLVVHLFVLGLLFGVIFKK